MITRSDRWYLSIVIIGVVLITTLPYIYATSMAGGEYVFSGFLLNPLDGNSYLAKMYQGWRGDWLFTLPYSAEIGRGAFLFMFYLLLGHISRITGIELLWTFHLARIVGGIVLLIVLYKLAVSIIRDHKTRRLAYLLVVMGAGMGWLAILGGTLTSDFWVAEAYPFLSIYVNPHFPIGLALVVIVVTPGFIKVSQVGEDNWLKGGIITAVTSFLLALIQPFGVVLACTILTVLAFWETYAHPGRFLKSPHLQRLGWVIFGAAPLLLYELLVINTDPLLSIWNAQNITTSPPIWDIILSFSPVLILALVGTVVLLKEKSQIARLAITWALLGVFLLYLPWGLQRRFIMGLYVPLVLLAFLWIELKTRNRRYFFLLTSIVILLSLPTNWLVLLAGRHGAQTQDPALYLTRGEAEAFEWIEVNTPADALILAGPDTGLFIPAHTGRRVFYGHPFETVHADEMEDLVTRFFLGDYQEDDLTWLKTADFLFFGPRERELGGLPPSGEYPVVYQSQDVTIHKINE